MKRRLLTVAHSYVVGLNRRLAHAIAQASRDRWEITAIVPRHFHGTRDLRSVNLELRDDEPCRIESVNAYFTSNVHCFYYGKRVRQLLAQSWDIVHCWEEPFVLSGWQIASWTRPCSRLVFSTYQNWSKKYPVPFNWMERDCLQRASAWITGGQTNVDALRDRPGYCKRPFRIIPMGVDTDWFQPNLVQRTSIRDSLGWSRDGSPVVGYLGRFVPEKGVELLTRTLAHQTSPWRALFVGTGPLENELRRWAATQGDRVRICTNVKHGDVPHYLNAMDVLCAPSQTTPSWREQFGRMLIEAFACGVPVIGSDSGEIPFVIGNEGEIVAEADDTAWAAAIGKLLESPARRQELAARGRERALTEYSWPVIARRHLEFFEWLLDGRTSDAH